MEKGRICNKDGIYNTVQKKKKQNQKNQKNQKKKKKNLGKLTGDVAFESCVTFSPRFLKLFMPWLIKLSKALERCCTEERNIKGGQKKQTAWNS